MNADTQSRQSIAHEGVVSLPDAQLYYREVGQGQPIIVLHGGPTFDHAYLLPDMDRLADSYRLIYYDQRGRGKSVGDTHNISVATEIADLEGLRNHRQLDTVALLGHSWGGYLAMEYAIRHPGCLSHLILMNTSPATRDDYLLFREELGRRKAAHQDIWEALVSSPEIKEGDPQALAAFYRLYFSTTIRQPHHLDTLMNNLTFTKEGYLRAGEIADRLTSETWELPDFNLIPQLKQLRTPTLIIHSEYDFLPLEIAVHIAEAIPGSRLVVLGECGHFPYIESVEEVRRVIADFLPPLNVLAERL